MLTPAPLTGLQDWYLCDCDGEWPQAAIVADPGDACQGLHIDPREAGWALHVDLEDAGLTGRDCDEITIRRTSDDWLHAWVQDGEFHVDCGPLTLTEAIKTYLAFAGRAPSAN